MGKCWRGKFPVKHKSGERFSVVVNNTPLYDDDGSLVGLTCLSGDARILEEIVGPSVLGKSYPNSAIVNNRLKSDLPNKGLSEHRRQPLQSAITSKITNLVSRISRKTEEMAAVLVSIECFFFWYFFLIYFLVYSFLDF